MPRGQVWNPCRNLQTAVNQPLIGKSIWRNNWRHQTRSRATWYISYRVKVIIYVYNIDVSWTYLTISNVKRVFVVEHNSRIQSPVVAESKSTILRYIVSYVWYKSGIVCKLSMYDIWTIVHFIREWKYTSICCIYSYIKSRRFLHVRKKVWKIAFSVFRGCSVTVQHKNHKNKQTKQKNTPRAVQQPWGQCTEVKLFLFFSLVQELECAFLCFVFFSANRQSQFADTSVQREVIWKEKRCITEFVTCNVVTHWGRRTDTCPNMVTEPSSEGEESETQINVYGKTFFPVLKAKRKQQQCPGLNERG